MIVLGTAALALLLLTWFVYPLTLVLLARGRRAPSARFDAPPAVSVILASRDHPEQVRDRVADLLATDHPKDRLEVVVGIDPGAGHDLDAYRRLLPAGVTVVPGDGPPGKPGNLNAAVRASRNPLLVFADTGQRFAPTAIARLVADLAHPQVGAVSGGYRISQGNPVTRIYWVLERLLRRSEAALHSMVGVTGAIYAIRRELWSDLPAGLLCDDLWVPLQIVRGGHRVLFREDALATDPRTFTHAQEYRRKVRTQAGILQLCAWMPEVLIPGRNPIWIQFVFHKLLRMATPVFLILAVVGFLPGALRLLTQLGPALPVLLAGVAAGVLLLVALRTGRRVLGEAAWTGVLLAAPLVAAWRAARGHWDVW